MVLDCLRSFTDLEELDETELYMCHKCKKKQKSTKKFWIQKLPKVSVELQVLRPVIGQGRPVPAHVSCSRVASRPWEKAEGTWEEMTGQKSDRAPPVFGGY